MKIRNSVLIFLLVFPFNLLAQQKDSLSTKLLCPLNDAKEAPKEKQAYDLGIEELKIVLVSATDTTVKACINGTVTNIMRDDDGKWELMFHNRDFYFFYSGITKVKVVKGQKLQAGDGLGTLNPGDKLELMIYDFETPLDPKKYVCHD